MGDEMKIRQANCLSFIMKILPYRTYVLYLVRSIFPLVSFSHFVFSLHEHMNCPSEARFQCLLVIFSNPHIFSMSINVINYPFI